MDAPAPTDKKGPPRFKQRIVRTFKSKAPRPGQKGFGDDIPGMEGLGTVTRASVRSGTDVGARRSGAQLLSQFITKVFIRDEVRALCRPLEFFYTNLGKPCLHGARLVHRGTAMLERVWARL
ncbi:hypothetical protein PDJAM_G00112500 [Pangasius djambal]|uniref:Uncharacterized protein n=1 Tax=Pangasius djambal TaxID=1691987 RepID=A0ACC5Y2A1_9TELE|nr:hypothetical protein [Pangasius djambal]